MRSMQVKFLRKWDVLELRYKGMEQDMILSFCFAENNGLGSGQNKGFLVIYCGCFRI